MNKISIAMTGMSLALNLNAGPSPIQVGRPFPELSLPGLTDQQVLSVAGFRGRALLLHLFASW